jgi:phosphohistidine phosphatase
MEIYILRHGEAEPRGKKIAEADRKLTARGEQDVQRVMKLAAKAKVDAQLVLTSPYIRAVDTGRIAAAELDSQPRLEQTEALLPDVLPDQVWKDLRSRSKVKEILLAGHEPQLSQLIAYLLGVPALKIDLKKGALVRISMDSLAVQPHGELKWVLTPGLANARRKAG